eukprot:TRINITY_DN39081_c0_g1_i1.p1 TRINITY_DN39081_c0_g1~~TRINITY_DN39081_c0_g1_i1.p1  ORF type:complete len:256 (+),score=13.07 TRINITY_DN39081_c0_g1_i1:44-769(+)
MTAKRQRTAPKTVLCFGDSNTFGASSEVEVAPGRLPYSDRWTSHLQEGLGCGYVVISEGLNGRTTVLDDPHECQLFCGMGGEGMNGRRYLTPCLYSHRPIDLVIIALGCNDLKHRFCLNGVDIALGMKTLVMDVQRSESGPGTNCPKVLVVSPPLCRETAASLSWGFKGCEAKSRATIEAYRAMCKEMAVPFVDLSQVASVGTDGIHFDASASAKIGAKMVEEVKKVLCREDGLHESDVTA